MSKDTKQGKTTGRNLDVREVQSPQLTERELKEDQSRKREGDSKDNSAS